MASFAGIRRRSGRKLNLAKASFGVMAGGRRYSSRRLILATGVKDFLPEIAGLQQR
jgi:thioredoxin reductase